jgi:hypothetical protein
MPGMLSRPAATLLFLVAIVASAGPASAAGLESQWRAACTRDAFAHCPLQALAADRSGVRDCLVQRLATLSDACRTVINAARADGGPTSFARTSMRP